MMEELDPTFSNPNKLKIVALLASSYFATFTYIKEALDISDSNLSKLMKSLVEKQYIEAFREHQGRGAIQSYKITKAGKQALKNYIQEIEKIIEPTKDKI